MYSMNVFTLFVIAELETSQRFTYGRIVEYVIYSRSEIIYSNRKEVTTAVCNNNMNVINIMLSKGSCIQKKLHTVGIYNALKNQPFLRSAPFLEAAYIQSLVHAGCQRTTEWSEALAVIVTQLLLLPQSFSNSELLTFWAC